MLDTKCEKQKKGFMLPQSNIAPTQKAILWIIGFINGTSSFDEYEVDDDSYEASRDAAGHVTFKQDRGAKGNGICSSVCYTPAQIPGVLNELRERLNKTNV